MPGPQIELCGAPRSSDDNVLDGFGSYNDDRRRTGSGDTSTVPWPRLNERFTQSFIHNRVYVVTKRLCKV